MHKAAWKVRTARFKNGWWMSFGLRRSAAWKLLTTLPEFMERLDECFVIMPTEAENLHAT